MDLAGINRPFAQRTFRRPEVAEHRLGSAAKDLQKF
jgi:hypothetical protein